MNPADICRECEVRQSVKELEEENMSLRKAGQRLTVEWEDGLLLLKLKEEEEEEEENNEERDIVSRYLLD